MRPGGLVPGGFGHSSGRESSVLLGSSRPLDRNPNQKCVHKRRHHDRLFLVDSESAIDSPDFYQTANGSVLCYDTSSIEFLVRIVHAKNELDRFVRHQKEDGSSSKKSNSECIQPKATSSTSPQAYQGKPQAWPRKFVSFWQIL